MNTNDNNKWLSAVVKIYITHEHKCSFITIYIFLCMFQATKSTTCFFLNFLAITVSEKNWDGKNFDKGHGIFFDEGHQLVLVVNWTLKSNLL